MRHEVGKRDLTHLRRHRDDARAQEGHVHECRRHRGAAGRRRIARRVLRGADMAPARAARQADRAAGCRGLLAAAARRCSTTSSTQGFADAVAARFRAASVDPAAAVLDALRRALSSDATPRNRAPAPPRSARRRCRAPVPKGSPKTSVATEELQRRVDVLHQPHRGLCDPPRGVGEQDQRQCR